MNPLYQFERVYSMCGYLLAMFQYQQISVLFLNLATTTLIGHLQNIQIQNYINYQIFNCMEYISFIIQLQQMGFPAQKSQKNNNQNKKWRVVLTRDIDSYRPERYALSKGYFMIPSQQQIFSNNGKSQNLVIGNEFGTVLWRGSVDLSQLAAPLAQTVLISDRQIEVYIGDYGKPPRGKELNRSCLVTFNSNSRIQEKYLRKICQENHTSLANCRPEMHQFTVEIPHFTKYTFNSLKASQKEVKEVNRMTDVIVGRPRRNRINLNIQNNLPLTSMRLKESFNGETVQTNTGSRGAELIFQGLKQLIVGSNSKFIQKEVPFPVVNINQHSKVLARENQNRKLYGFNNYQHSVYNFPVLQNILMCAEGGIVKLKNYENYQKLQCYNFKNHQEQHEIVDLGLQSLLMLKEELTPELVSSIITDSCYQFSVRRLLSLHALLFCGQICFQFTRNKTYSIRSISRYSLTENKRQELIKDWLAWAIRQRYDDSSLNQPAKTKLMEALALRMPQRAIDLLLVNNRWTEAQVIANLEDSQFRQILPQDYLIDLEPDLQKLLGNSVEVLFDLGKDWLISLALCLWYRRGEDLAKQVAEVINFQSRHGQIDKCWGLQFRLFQLYVLSKKLEIYDGLYLDKKNDRETACGQWIITNMLNLGHIESEKTDSLGKNGKLLHGYYRYQVTLSVIEPLIKKMPSIALDIISATKGLLQNQKQVLIKRIKERESGLLEQIDNMISKRNLIGALQLCVKETQITDALAERAYGLATHPDLLINYRRDISDQMIQLLSKHRQHFGDLILIIQFQRDASIGLNQLKRMVEIYGGLSKFNGSFGGQVKRAIISKISMCLAGWVSKRPDLIASIARDTQLLKKIKELPKSQELASYFAGHEKQQ